MPVDFALNEAVAAFDQVFQPLGEASSRSAVDQIMIEAQGHAEVFADGYLPVDDTWLLREAAEGDVECTVFHWDSPTSIFPKHADRRYAHRPAVSLLHLRIPPSIHQKIGQMNLKTTTGKNWKSLKLTQAFSTASTWAALIS